MPGWYEFYRTPCVICGHVGGCMIYKDGDRVACIRIESDTYFSKNSALPSFLHWLKPRERRKIDVQEVEEYQDSKKLDAATLDRVYRTLLDFLDLSDYHYEHLTSPKRKLTDRQILIRQYVSFPEKPWDCVRRIAQSLGMDDFEGVPGFYYRDNRYWTIAGTDGILIPYRNQYNQIVGFQYRIDRPFNVAEVKENKRGLRAEIQQPNFVRVTYNGKVVMEEEVPLSKTWKNVFKEGELLGWIRVAKGNRYFWLSSANKPKGTGSGNPAPLHVSVPTETLANWEVGTLHKARTVWLTEGALKADIAVDLIGKLYDPVELEDIGTTMIALPGVGSWRLALPVMKEMGVEQVNLCFDADAVSNPHVKLHLFQCAKVLKQEGYSANLVLWNEDEGKGIDDLFLQNKLPQIKRLF